MKAVKSPELFHLRNEQSSPNASVTNHNGCVFFSVRLNFRRASQRNAFTMIELIIVAGIIALATGVGLMSFRDSSTLSNRAANNLVMAMDLQRATDQLIGALLEGTEVISPPAGHSKGFVVILDMYNFTRMLYLEAETPALNSLSGKTYSLISYTDHYEGSYNPERKRRLFGKIKQLKFTPVTPGLIQAHLILVNDAGKELGTLIDLPLKNVSSVYD